MLCCVPYCEGESGSNVICSIHRKDFKKLTGYRKTQIMNLWHDIVVARSYDAEIDRYICQLCHRPFIREAICGDHIESKGSAHHRKFDVTNGRACCKDCNRSDNPNRFSKDELTRI